MITHRHVLFLLSCAVTAVTLCADVAAQITVPFNITVQTGSNIILPAYNNVSANWQMAGLQSIGGIPNRTVVCATVNPIGGGADDATNIKNAINTCPAGQVVMLGSSSCGTNCAFTIHGADQPFLVTTGITVRGYGPCNKTRVHPTDATTPYCTTSITVSDGPTQFSGGNCSGSCSYNPIFLLAPSGVSGWAVGCGGAGAAGPGAGGTGRGCGETDLAVDAAQGQTTIQVASTSRFAVGHWAYINEAVAPVATNDPQIPNQCTQYMADTDWLSPSGSPATGRVLLPEGTGCTWGATDIPWGTDPNTASGNVQCWFTNCGKIISEIHQIASIGAGPCPGANCTLTFTSPLTIAFRQSGNHNAAAMDGPTDGSGNYIGMLQQASVENMSLIRVSGGGVSMQFCAYCWIKNVETSAWFSPIGCFGFWGSWRSQAEGVLCDNIWDSTNAGWEYPMHLEFGSTEILIENSITVLGGGKGMSARGGGAGSVYAYNYQDSQFYDRQSAIGDYWLDVGLAMGHSVGAHHVLMEGNYAVNCDGENTHGPTHYMVFFRNQCAGYRTAFTDLSSGGAGVSVNDAAGIGWQSTSTGGASYVANPPAPLRAAGPQAYNYWYAYVGNVLGVTGVTTAANGWGYSGDWSTPKKMWYPGWDNNSAIGGAESDPNLSSVTSATPPTSWTGGPFVFNHGNYDYVNGSIVDWRNGYSQNLVNSLYLSSAPSFFSSGASCTYTWPWVQSASTPPIKNNSCSGSGLPAKARWEAGTPFVQP
jgi:hypothetical protein